MVLISSVRLEAVPQADKRRVLSCIVRSEATDDERQADHFVQLGAGSCSYSHTAAATRRATTVYLLVVMVLVALQCHSLPPPNTPPTTFLKNPS